MSLLSLASRLTGVVFDSLRNAQNQVTLVSCMEVDSFAMDSPSCLAVAACLAAKTRSVFIVGRVCFVSVFFCHARAEARAESRLAVRIA